MRLLIGALVLFFLTAGTFKMLERGLGEMYGQPLSYAVDRLGLPDGKVEMEGETVYTWSTDIANQWGGGAQLSCRIRISVKDGRITRGDYSGNQGACRLYAKALKRRR